MVLLEILALPQFIEMIHYFHIIVKAQSDLTFEIDGVITRHIATVIKASDGLTDKNACDNI